MGKSIVENSKNYIKKIFPEVQIQETNSEVIFEGHFIIETRKGDFEIHEAPLLKIIMNKQYPLLLPICYDVDEKIQNYHIFKDHSLCVSTILDMAIKLRNSVCIQDYIDKFLIPYFLSYRYWQKTKQDLNGARSHGPEGIYESLQDYLKCNISDYELKLLLCWAAKMRKFRKCIPFSLQNYYLSHYLTHMKKLRLLGIQYLRLQNKVLTNL